MLALNVEGDDWTTTRPVARDRPRRRGATPAVRSLDGQRGDHLRPLPPSELDVLPTQEPQSRPSRRVLVVDDEPAMRLLLRVNLPFAGYEVVEAPDGEAAFARIREEDFDLLVLDVMMPGMSGFELAERLRADAATAELPIVFVSARADQEDVERGFALGAIDYVTKPFDPLRLGEHLNALLDEKTGGEDDRTMRSRLLDDEPERAS